MSESERAHGRAKRVKGACIIPGIFLAGMALTSVNFFPNGWMAFIPYEIARFMVILFCFYGGISILKDLILFLMKNSD